MARRNAPLTRCLLDACMVLLGKASMTESCGSKMRPLQAGLRRCREGGRRSRYIFGGLDERDRAMMPDQSFEGGSSEGTVAAGFAPLEIRVDTVGSLVTPADRNGVYALKCGHGVVDDARLLGLSESMDCVGVMWKTARGVAALPTLAYREA
ncbi:hypothetical protein K431DRAFT_299526 [Polychaeton citri CBS 116435]|uniref:Amidase domain-containing protein n=1 Tax=Polychaeton citri CBS 116435 TaxID=1314669 RepID=A0A9P4URM3_9PEZI|nr:hypothetical protein K431DRAFT_299526 [Polychaeton citri CBS 116435]